MAADKGACWNQKWSKSGRLSLLPRDAALRKMAISHCPPITRQRALVDSKLLGRPRMSVISTYLNDTAQTPLGRFVIQPSLKQTRWQIEPMELKPYCTAALASTVEGVIISSPSSRTRLIANHRLPRRFFSNSTVVHTKWVTWTKPRPF